ncbi:MAG: heme A synthase [Oceanospirillaceae bacterium]|nr:heme A synthase [Oceanospirillaceae bacterium]
MENCARIVNAAIGLALVVVLLGGWTRLNEAGLGCPDWPSCYGHFVLPGADEVSTRIEPFFPGHHVDLKKGWIEMVHRYAASLLGLLIIVQSVWIWRTDVEKPLKVLSLGLVGLVIVQGLFGMWTVTLKLVPWVVTTHLLGGLATLTLLVRLRQRLKRAVNGDVVAGRDWSARFLVTVLFAQIALGGWTSSNYAGWACEEWISCHSVPGGQYDFVQGFDLFQPVGPNYEGGLLPAPARSAIQVTHRLGALVLGLAIVVVGVRLYGRPSIRPWLYGVGALWFLQAVIGILNVIWLLPLPLAVSHHAMAVALLLVTVGLYDRAYRREKEVYHGYLSTG